MIGRRGFFGTIAGFFVGFAFKVKSSFAAPEPNNNRILGCDNNSVFGCEADVAPGKKNSVAMGHGAVANESNMVALGNADIRKLRVGSMEFLMEDGVLYFVNRGTGQRFLVELSLVQDNPAPR